MNNTRAGRGPSSSTGGTERLGLLWDGRVIIAGGTLGVSVEIFDPITETFASAGELLQPLEDHQATRLRTGKVLLMGQDSGIGVAVNKNNKVDSW